MSDRRRVLLLKGARDSGKCDPYVQVRFLTDRTTQFDYTIFQPTLMKPSYHFLLYFGFCRSQPPYRAFATTLRFSAAGVRMKMRGAGAVKLRLVKCKEKNAWQFPAFYPLYLGTSPRPTSHRIIASRNLDVRLNHQKLYRRKRLICQS